MAVIEQNNKFHTRSSDRGLDVCEVLFVDVDLDALGRVGGKLGELAGNNAQHLWRDVLVRLRVENISTKTLAEEGAHAPLLELECVVGGGL